jgi:hypothetical protein
MRGTEANASANCALDTLDAQPGQATVASKPDLFSFSVVNVDEI